MELWMEKVGWIGKDRWKKGRRGGGGVSGWRDEGG